MRIERSQVIDRPPADVFRFVAVNHVRNHPRWDPNMELEQLSEGPIRVGTVIRRRHTRGGVPVDGIMEIVEYEPDRSMGAVIRDGPVQMRGWMTVRPVGQASTTLTFDIEIPAMAEPMDASPVEASLRRIKQLIESET